MIKAEYGKHHIPVRYTRSLARFFRKAPVVMQVASYFYKIFQPKFTVGVVGVVFNERQQVLVVEHLFHPQIPWGLPGGWVSKHEHPAASLKREFLEELGLEVRVNHIVHTEIREHNHLDIAYLCETRDNITTLNYELLNYGWYDISALPKLRIFHYQAILNAQNLLLTR